MILSDISVETVKSLTVTIAAAILLGVAVALLVNKIQHPSNRFLGWRARRRILKEMSEQNALPLDDAIKHIAYVARKNRFSEMDVWDLFKELDYSRYGIEQAIRSLESQNILERELFRRLIPPYEYVYYMPLHARQAYEVELKQRAKNPEPEKRDVSAELQTLVAKVRDAQEAAFLDETMKCLHIDANRAAIVMAWNLAYHHLRHWILDKHLAEFNTQLPLSYPKRYGPASCHDDFPDKESVTLEVCKAAGFLDKTRKGILEGALNDRNRYAHPSPAHATGPEAAGYVSKLLKNVITDPYFS
jgi:hypothetical protein